MNDATPLKKSDTEPFHVRQLDDDGLAFAVSTHLDVRGLTCPMPALKSLEMSQKLTAGEVLEVVGDWPGSKFEVPFAVTGKPGLEVVRIIESSIPDDETWWIYVRRLP
jgi:TusA-related sulfurtransferase